MMKKVMNTAKAVLGYLNKDVRDVASDLVEIGGKGLAVVTGSVVAASQLVHSNVASAQTGVDYSQITGAADWSTVATAVITIFAAGALVIVAFVGGKFLLRAIRGA